MRIRLIGSDHADCELEVLQNIGVWIPVHSLGTVLRGMTITCGPQTTHGYAQGFFLVYVLSSRAVTQGGEPTYGLTWLCSQSTSDIQGRAGYSAIRVMACLSSSRKREAAYVNVVAADMSASRKTNLYNFD